MIIALLLFVCQPNAEVVDRCDSIELNHLYNDEAIWQFDQYIFWNWNPSESTFEVVHWVRAKEHVRLEGNELTWPDGWLLRRVNSKSFKETWTQYDPEVLNRQKVPVVKRRGLFNPHKQKP